MERNGYVNHWISREQGRHVVIKSGSFTIFSSRVYRFTYTSCSWTVSGSASFTLDLTFAWRIGTLCRKMASYEFHNEVSICIGFGGIPSFVVSRSTSYPTEYLLVLLQMEDYAF
ncbi:hypothetical protein NPIL_654211 [Nephila pilipes]|uniref:Uncharacterized protein n=1 Tax=Nephila pilipes TaxID=299642 RepID=A0A8X6TEX6_NEPPI|nr:hypothetical protein NPIL_654211 [Nephila pilipes]